MKIKLFALLAGLSIAGTGDAVAGSKSQPKKAAKEVQLSVTSDGFQPAEIKTKAGQPLRLVITRTTDRTCAKEVVIKDLGVSKPLPLNEPVAVEITPKKNGQLRYACSMDMIAGVIVVE
jgi:plastocyanin domain-containing protein